MIRTALYPVSTDTLPVARYINKHSQEYCITTLLAFPGSGLCGKDAGYADNRGITGTVVSESFHKTKDMWDVIFIAEHPDLFGEAHIHELTLEAIKCALDLNKQVICNARLLPYELNIIKESINKSDSFIYLPEEEINLPKKNFGSLFSPSSYVVFVGGLIREVNSFEVFLSLVGKLKSKYDVLPFSTDVNCELCNAKSLYPILYSNDYSETEKIYAINNYVELFSEKKPPDIIIVHISEPMMEYSDRITNGFGILPYMISKALIPDYFICGIPYMYGHSDYIRGVSEGIYTKLGYGIDYVHLGNAELDASIIYEMLKISASYVPYKVVENQIKQFCFDTEIPVSNVLTSEGLDDLLKTLLDEIKKSTHIVSIIS